jgi:hypothetical protein
MADEPTPEPKIEENVDAARRSAKDVTVTGDETIPDVVNLRDEAVREGQGLGG